MILDESRHKSECSRKKLFHPIMESTGGETTMGGVGIFRKCNRGREF